MKKEKRKNLTAAVCMLTAFLVWTAAVCCVGREAIGPNGSVVGLAPLNRFVHERIGVNMALYTVTDVLGLVPIGFAAGFAILGAFQLIKRKNIRKVDRSILVLGVFYIAVAAVFLFFEKCVVNFRPVLIDGVLEASYPSSTTMLAMCVMPTAIMQLNGRIQNRTMGRCISVFLALFTAFMVIGRIFSGVHWFSDIIGGIFVSGGLVLLYRAVCTMVQQ